MRNGTFLALCLTTLATTAFARPQVGEEIRDKKAPPAPPAVTYAVTPTGAKQAAIVKITGAFGPQPPTASLENPTATPATSVAMDRLTFTATSVELRVPNAGAQAFNGQIRIVVGNGSVKLVPFSYLPEVETRVMHLDNTIWAASGLPQYDSQINGPEIVLNPRDPMYVRYQWLGPFGGKGDDEFFRKVTLSPGWTVESVEVFPLVDGGQGGASVVESRKGTNSPYVKVHWWGNAFSKMAYSMNIRVVGPKGTQACSECCKWGKCI